MFGYSHPDYSRSFCDYGTPVHLKNCDGWVVKRSIPGTSSFDAMGPYPLFFCEKWEEMYKDLNDLESKGELTSLSLVTDPFADLNEDLLKESFPDVCIPFKDHYVVDLEEPLDLIVSNHHRRYTRKAFKEVKVEIYENTDEFLDEWVDLFNVLKKKHNIKGIRSFSKKAFEIQMKIPGVVIFRATKDGEPVGMHIWCTHGDRAYGHLGALNREGYYTNASYAIYWSVIEHYMDMGCRWLDWGGGAGVNKKNNGLTEFKEGWSTGFKKTHFCGRILNRERYDLINEEKKIDETPFFPAYRVGEFE